MTDSHLAIERELQKEIEGEVRFDAYTKALYSTDASIYQIEPIGVVIPKHKQDVVAAVRLAAKHGLPILPRGGGTSLSGQTVGHAIHLDFSKYMNEILEFNPEQRWVRLQPGLVQDVLNAFLRPKGFLLGPDTASILWSGGRPSIIAWQPVIEANRVFMVRQTGFPPGGEPNG